MSKDGRSVNLGRGEQTGDLYEFAALFRKGGIDRNQGPGRRFITGACRIRLAFEPEIASRACIGGSGYERGDPQSVGRGEARQPGAKLVES
jgi:hypothetical protein